MLTFLYHYPLGKGLLGLLIRPGLSRAAGAFLDTRLSKGLIPFFVRSNGIDLSEYETEGWRSFNDCFSRRIRPGKRPVDMAEDALIAPCDGLLRCYDIHEGTVLPVKQSRFSVPELLGSSRLARRYEGGLCLVYRLCVDHYHRYSYVESGEKSRNVFLPGVLHTVQPVACEALPVYVRNCRELTLIRTAHGGTIAQMEVGAMLVGRIVNLEQEASVVRGREKGYFAYGGSTIIVLLQRGKAAVREDIQRASAAGEEVPVRLGERVGSYNKGL